MSFQKEIVSNFLRVGVLKYSGLIVSFIGSAFISRLLSPSEYGVHATATIYFGLFFLFINFSFNMIIIRHKDDYEFQLVISKILTSVSLVLGLLFLMLAYPLSLWYGNPELWPVFTIYAIALVFASFPIIHESVLSKREQFTFIASVGLITTLAQTILTYILALQGFSYWSIIIPFLLSPLVRFALYRRKVKISLFHPEIGISKIKRVARSIKEAVLDMTAFQLLVYASSNVDNLYVSKIHGSADLGLYNRAYTLNRLPVQIVSGIINTIQFPMFQRLKESSQDNEKLIRKEFSSYVGVLGYMAFLPVVILHLYAEDLSALIWGEDWREVGLYLYPLSILLPTSIMLNASGNMFVLYNSERRLVYNSIVSAVSAIIGASIGIMFSIEGMILGVIIGRLLGSIPITMYLGYMKSFGFTFSETISVWIVNYLAVVCLLLAYVIQSMLFTSVVLSIYSIISLSGIYNYWSRHYNHG